MKNIAPTTTASNGLLNINKQIKEITFNRRFNLNLLICDIFQKKIELNMRNKSFEK